MSEWLKELPRKSGWYFILDSLGDVFIGDVEGRDKDDDGWVWLRGGEFRIYLTPNTRAECGDEMQDDSWLNWSWCGPLKMPPFPQNPKNNR